MSSKGSDITAVADGAVRICANVLKQNTTRSQAQKLLENKKKKKNTLSSELGSLRCVGAQRGGESENTETYKLLQGVGPHPPLNAIRVIHDGR